MRRYGPDSQHDMIHFWQFEDRSTNYYAPTHKRDILHRFLSAFLQWKKLIVRAERPREKAISSHMFVMITIQAKWRRLAVILGESVPCDSDYEET